MNSKLLELEDIIHVAKFQKIQDDIARATDLSLITVDYKGRPITKHSNCSAFCGAVRKEPRYNKLCQKCDSRGGLEAARLQEPYIYTCHFGLVDFAIPIVLNDRYLGAVMAGQVFLKHKNEAGELERIVSDPHNELDEAEGIHYQTLMKKIPTMSLEKVKALADMLFHITNYIVEEAILKASLNLQNQQILEASLSGGAQQKYISNLVMVDQVIEGIGFSDTSQGKQQLLEPALAYIQKHYYKEITLDKMAELCSISPSYFSKLFNQELGEHFANYVNGVKIAHAKELLKITSIPIVNIALNLGYDNCGYFIKVFKKREGVTPAIYRKSVMEI